MLLLVAGRRDRSRPVLLRSLAFNTLIPDIYISSTCNFKAMPSAAMPMANPTAAEVAGPGPARADASRRWLWLALVGMGFLALANLCIGRAVADIPEGVVPWGELGVLAAGFLFSALVLGLWLAAHLQPNLSAAWRERRQRRAGMICICGGAINFAGLICLTIAFAVDGDSAPVSAAITSGAAAVVAVTSWLLFDETLGPSEIFGIAVATAGVVLMAVVESAAVSAVVPMFGVGAMFLFGFAQITQKYSGSHMAEDVASVCFFVGNGAIGLIPLFIGLGAGGGELQHTGLADAGYAFLAGLLLCVDMFCATYAFAQGPAGPISAIIQSSAILLLLLQWSILGTAPSVIVSTRTHSVASRSGARVQHRSNRRT